MHARSSGNQTVTTNAGSPGHALRWLLSSDRRDWEAVASAEEARQLLAEREPALVVTDLNLAGQWSRIDLLAWMWRSSRLRGVPMLLMTGTDPDGARSLLRVAGLDHVEILPKPFERVQLKESLELLAVRTGQTQAQSLWKACTLWMIEWSVVIAEPVTGAAIAGALTIPTAKNGSTRYLVMALSLNEALLNGLSTVSFRPFGRHA